MWGDRSAWHRVRKGHGHCLATVPGPVSVALTEETRCSWMLPGTWHMRSPEGGAACPAGHGSLRKAGLYWSPAISRPWLCHGTTGLLSPSRMSAHPQGAAGNSQWPAVGSAGGQAAWSLEGRAGPGSPRHVVSSSRTQRWACWRGGRGFHRQEGTLWGRSLVLSASLSFCFLPEEFCPSQNKICRLFTV